MSDVVAAVSEPRRFVIRRAFVIPLGLVLLLMAVLLVVSIQHGQPAAKVAFLVIFALPVAVLFAACAFRRLEIDAAGATSFRLFGSRRIEFAAVTALEAVQVRSRVFLTLVAGEDTFLIVSNSYADFPALVGLLMRAVPEAALSEEVCRLAEAPPTRYADVAMACFAVAALVYVLAAQFQG